MKLWKKISRAETEEEAMMAQIEEKVKEETAQLVKAEEAAQASEDAAGNEAEEGTSQAAKPEKQGRKLLKNPAAAGKRIRQLPRKGQRPTKIRRMPSGREKRKKLRKRLLFIGVPVLLLAAFIGRSVFAGSKGIPVMVTNTVRGDVEAVVNTSGNVSSEEEKTYFAPVGSKVFKIQVSEGEAVKKGEELLRFDADSLAVEKQKAQLESQVSAESYQENMAKDAKVQGDLAEANHNLPILEQQIADNTNYLNELQKNYENIRNDRYAELKRIEMELTETLRDQEAHGASSGDIQYTQDSLTANQYHQSLLDQNKDLVEMKREIDKTQETLNELKEYEAEMKSQQASTEGTALNSHGKSRLEADNQLTQLTAEKTLKGIESVENGVKADFDGVVTKVTAVEGSTVQEGAELVTLMSTADVKVTVKLSKYDLVSVAEGQQAEVTIAGNVYEGKVEKVNRLAQENANGTPVISADIRITNPDDKIYLGIEAKVLVHTQKAENVLLIPLEAVNTDQTGDFVYVVAENIVAKKYVETGVASDDQIEIRDGLQEGEQVVTDLSGNITEGMLVSPMVQQ